MCICDVEVGKISYRIYTWHGHGSSQMTAGRVKILQRQAETVEADVYAMGHVHELFDTTLPKREVVKGGFEDIFRHYILTGAYLKWDESYAEQNGYRMVKMGSPLLILDNKQKNSTVDLTWCK